jgi:RHS repeat-associated protein
MTRYAYDPRSFRLIRLRSEPYTHVDGGEGPTYRPHGEVLQDYGYDHDLAGNIRTIHDRTPGSGIPNNPEALQATDPRLRHLLGSGDALDRRLSYDPVYRLRTATGREHASPPATDPWIDVPRGTNITKAQAYRETYRYDAVGSLLQLVHASTGGFTRDFAVDPASNQLQQMTTGGTPFAYHFDPNGNLVAETTSRHFAWNHADRLASFATRAPGAEPSVHAQYLYDATGRRVKKLLRRQGGAVEVTHYIGQAWEHHRWSASPAGENTVVQVLDGERRIALVRVGPAHPDDLGPAVAYQLGDHLGSSAVVLDEFGTPTNREELTPYGETSFGSYSRKRYRFTGMERDHESGLSYHLARYYAPWLARWISADPLGAEAGNHLYRYAADNPVLNVDRDGHDEQEEPGVKPVKFKVKVWGFAVSDEPVTDSSGEETGHVSIVKGAIKLKPRDLGVEATVSVVDAEVSAKIAGPVRLLVSGAVLKFKGSVSRKGVEVDVAPIETGVGAAVGPVRGKLLFGLSAGFKLQEGKFKIKGVYGIGGELELDVSKVVQSILFPKGPSQLQVTHDWAAPTPVETSIRSVSVAHETAPPAPKPRPHHRIVLPAHTVHGCGFGPAADGPGPHGKAYAGASPLR